MEFFNFRSRTIAAGIAGTLALIGCAEDVKVTPEVPAQVVSHEYDDRDVWVTYVLVNKVLVPFTHIDPEHFYLTVEQCGHKEFKDEDNTDGCGQIQVEVNEELYRNTQNGETIVFQES